MKKHLILLFFSPLFAFAQAVNFDSLEQVVENNNFKDETEKLNAIEDLAEAYLMATPSSRFNDAIALSLKEEKTLSFTASNDAIGMFYARLGQSYQYQDAYSNVNSKEKSAFYYEKAISYLEASGDSTLLSAALNGCAQVILYIEPSKALTYFQRSAKIGETNEDDYSGLLLDYSGICNALSVMGRMDEAFVYSSKILDIIPKVDELETVIYACGSIGVLYSNTGKFEYAEDLFQEAYDASLKLKNDEYIYNMLVYLAGIKVKKINPSAQELALTKTQLDECNVYYSKKENESLLKQINSYYIPYYRHIEDYKKAAEYANKFLNSVLATNDRQSIGTAYTYQGMVYEDMMEFDSAIISYEKVIEFAKESSNDILLSEAYKSLYKIAKMQKNFEQALTYYEQYFIHHDTIYNQKLQKLLGTEGARLDIAGEQKARKTAELEAELLSSRNTLYGAIALGLLVILLIGGYLYQQLQKTRKQLEDQNLELSQLNANKDKFFGIIAHDIRSPITALDGVGNQIAYYLSSNDTNKLQRLGDRIDETAKRLTNLLDNLLNWALLQTGMIPYRPFSLNLKETTDEILKLYEALAETKKIDLVNNIPQELEIFADESALNTIIRNLINNALKFTNENGTVSISSYEKDEKAFITINDTGTGVHAEKLERLFDLDRTSTKGTAGEKGSGLGLMLCKELVELNKGTIQVMSELGKGSAFTFTIPLNKNSGNS